MREKRPLAFGGVLVVGCGFCLVPLFGFGVACVLFPSSCCVSFPFNDDLGTRGKKSQGEFSILIARAPECPFLGAQSE